MYNLSYNPLEKITVGKPCNRIDYIKEKCAGKTVLDLGCFDETGLIKQNSGFWLFEEISMVAETLIGIDNSVKLPENGLIINERAQILKGDIIVFNYEKLSMHSFDIIIAGELIEHLTDTVKFFNHIRIKFPGKKLICTTPNSTSLSNFLLSLFNRESTHIDHKQIYSFKTLNTLCKIANFSDWKITPYYVKYTEMILASGPIKKNIVKVAESAVNVTEYLFPLLCGGYVIEIDL